MTAIVQHIIDFKKTSDFRLGNFLNAKLENIKLHLLKKMLDRHVTKANKKIELHKEVLLKIYNEIDFLSIEEAKKFKPMFDDVRIKVTQRNQKYKELLHAYDSRLEKGNRDLERLSNRISAKLHKKIHSESPYIQTEQYITDKLHANSREYILDALREEASC